MKRFFYLFLAFLVFSFVSCAGDSKIEKLEPSSPVVEKPKPPVEEEIPKTQNEERPSEEENPETQNEEKPSEEEISETQNEEKPSEKETSSENQDENAQKNAFEAETFDFENAEVVPEGEGFFISKEEEIKKENKQPPVVVTEKEVIEPEKPLVVETPNVVKTSAVSETKIETKVEEKQGDEISNAENNSVAIETSENNSTALDISENDSAALDIPENETSLEEAAEEIEKLPIIPSRSVKILKGQYLDVNYPGTGWVYLGEIDENGNGEKKLTYFGRKLGNENTTFTLRSRNQGTAILHFYKNDNLTGTYIDDYLEVTIEDTVASSSAMRTTAPSYAEAVPKKPEKVAKVEKKEAQKETEPEKKAESDGETEKKSSQLSPSSKKDVADNKKGTTIVQTSESEPTYSSPSVPSTSSTPKVSASQAKTENAPSLPEKEDELFAYAKKCYDEKKYEEALVAVQKYLDISGSKTDEALYLQGLIYESDSSVRNIRNAIDCFDSVVKNYPASEFWQKSRNRSIYLRRFYVEIR